MTCINRTTARRRSSLGVGALGLLAQLLAGAVGTAHANPLPPAPPPALDDPRALAFMAGCWRAERSNGTVTEEIWMEPAPNGTLGMSRTSRDGRMGGYEFSKLEVDDGVVHYVANPSGQEEASFRLTRLEGRLAVFENPEHDFPQKIVYDARVTDRIDASVSGPDEEGKVLTLEYPFRRVKCPGG